MQHRFLAVFSTLLFFAFSGCNDSDKTKPKGAENPPAPAPTTPAAPTSKITSENFLRITSSMTKPDVLLILGQPTKTDDLLTKTAAQMLTWRDGEKRITIVFGYKGEIIRKEHHGLD
jgi:outer membrane protein assembly factor BamE (lipoprotein component of BamABCDE complex)